MREIKLLINKLRNDEIQELIDYLESLLEIKSQQGMVDNLNEVLNET